MIEIIRSLLVIAVLVWSAVWWFGGIALCPYAPSWLIAALDLFVFSCFLYLLDLLPRWLTGKKDDP